MRPSDILALAHPCALCPVAGPEVAFSRRYDCWLCPDCGEGADDPDA